MIHIVRYWSPYGNLYKEPFRTAEAALERYRNLLAAGHINLKLYTQHRTDEVGPEVDL